MAPPAASDGASPGTPPPEPWVEREVEVILGRLLQWGVGIAASVVLVGGVLYLIRFGGGQPQYGTFRGEPNDLRHVAGIVRSVADGGSRGIIQFGLLLLIATPVARVALSLLVFARDKDRLYVRLTAFVLAILLLSLTGIGP